MFTDLKVNDFRILKNKELQLGRYATMLAGWNATGKSTVLALLANSSELKAEEGKTYNGKLFRAEFSEIFKGSEEHDKSEVKHRLELIWEENGAKEKKTFRTTWQDKGSRFRLIPMGKDPKNPKKVTAAKFNIPVIYMGLSRLYPLGETGDDQFQPSTQKFKCDEDRNWFIAAYKDVLSLSETVVEITNIDFKSAKKNSSGINAENYAWMTNSSGQDNLSQILFALLSFKNLKRENARAFRGGLLVIDELEATFHPKAQEKIINLLIKEARATGFQIVFTTHSLTTIEFFARRMRSNDVNIIYHYFTKANANLEIEKNKPIQEIRDDLLMSLIKSDQPQKLTVYAEDDEGRWLLRRLLKGHARRIILPRVNISCQALIDLMNVERSFANYLTVFDGDLTKKDEKRIKRNKRNYLILPGDGQKSPEMLIRDFIKSDASDTYFREQHAKNPRLKREYFNENDVALDGRDARVVYKEWFRTHKDIFEKSKIIEYWMQANEKACKVFIDQFHRKHDMLAKKLNMPAIEQG